MKEVKGKRAFWRPSSAEELERLVERGLGRVRIDAAGCWIFDGARANGYGVVKHRSRMRYLHRLVFQWVVGVIPEGFELDHLCRNRACCNPEHLEAVTHLENVRRGLKGPILMTVCANGHQYTEVNTRRRGDGKRECVTCLRSRNERKYQTKLNKKWASRIVVMFG